MTPEKLDNSTLAVIRLAIGYRLKVAPDCDQSDVPPQLMRLVRAFDDTPTKVAPSIAPDDR